MNTPLVVLACAAGYSVAILAYVFWMGLRRPPGEDTEYDVPDPIEDELDGLWQDLGGEG